MFKFSPRKSVKSPRNSDLSPSQSKKTRLKDEKSDPKSSKKSPSRDTVSSVPPRTPIRELSTSAKTPSRDITTTPGYPGISRTPTREKFNVTLSPKLSSPALPLTPSPRPVLSGRESKTPTGGTESLWGRKLDDSTFTLFWAFVSDCLHWLRTHEAHNKCQELFLKSGNEANVLLLQNTLDKQLNEFRFSDDEDPYSIVTLLKRFFKAMAEPLFTFRLYPTFVALVHIQHEQEKKNAIRTALTLLPKNNVRLLGFLLQYLHYVTSGSTTTIDATNLAAVFGPTLLRPEFETPFILISDLSSVTSVVAALIENFEYFMKQPSSFPNPPIKEQEDKSKEFEKEMRKIYAKHCCATLKALKSVQASCGYDDSHWKLKIIAIGDNIKEGDYSMVNLLSSKEIIMTVSTPSPLPTFCTIPSLPALSSGSLPMLPTDKSPPVSPRSSPRQRKTIQDRSISVNQSLVKVLTKVMGESEDMKTIHEDSEKKQNREHKMSSEKSENTPKSQKLDTEVKSPKVSFGESSIERPRLFFRNTSDKKENEADSEADMEYEKFVVMVSTYNEDELNAQESFSDDQENSSSSSMSYSDPLMKQEHQEIEKVLFHICGEEIPEEEKIELKKMIKVVFLGEEEQ